MNQITKATRLLYENISVELIDIRYRLLLLNQMFVKEDTNNLLNQVAIRFFRTLKWDLFHTNILAISRLTDPSISSNKYENASLSQLIECLDKPSHVTLI